MAGSSQHPDAQYRASKLKYFLYRRALAQVFAFVKQWGEQHGKFVPCYVATHSLITQGTSDWQRSKKQTNDHETDWADLYAV